MNSSQDGVGVSISMAVSMAGDEREERFGGATLDDKLREVDALVARLWAGLPPNTLLVLASAHGDLGEADRVRVSVSVCVCVHVCMLIQPLSKDLSHKTHTQEHRAKRMAIEGDKSWLVH